MNRLPVIGVMGSGTDPHPERAGALGRWLAGRGVHLLTGGGGGVMASVSEAFCSVDGRAGLCVGVLPAGDEPGSSRDGYPNDWVELAVRTHLPLSGREGREPMSRNHINVLTPDVIVVLPGSAGTVSEMALALEYGRPAVAWLRSPAEIPGLPQAIKIKFDLDGVRAFVEEHLAGATGGEVSAQG